MLIHRMIKCFPTSKHTCLESDTTSHGRFGVPFRLPIECCSVVAVGWLRGLSSDISPGDVIADRVLWFEGIGLGSSFTYGIFFQIVSASKSERHGG